MTPTITNAVRAPTSASIFGATIEPRATAAMASSRTPNTLESIS